MTKTFLLILTDEYRGTISTVTATDKGQAYPALGIVLAWHWILATESRLLAKDDKSLSFQTVSDSLNL